MKALIASLIVFVVISPAFAKPISVQVKGMVCAFCAQGIEKKFKSLAEVDRVHVSLETKKVEIETKAGQDIDDARIAKIVTEAGYNVVKIERAP